jgi:protein-tyrosine phosphatase
MAEAIFEDRLVKGYPRLFPLVRADSAGTVAIDGNRVTETAVQAMDLWGIDLSRHRAQFLTPRLAREADLIVAMAREHLLAIERLGEELSGKAFTLKYLSSRRGDALERLGGSQVLDEGELDTRLGLLKSWLDGERRSSEGRDPEMMSSDIIDPIGGSLETYLTVAEDVSAGLEELMLVLFGLPEVQG